MPRPREDWAALLERILDGSENDGRGWSSIEYLGDRKAHEFIVEQLSVARPDDSILVYRMEHSDPAIAMPELGRSTVHAEGAALMREWIGAMSGDC